MSFDPDAYLAGRPQKEAPKDAFDPDAYLAAAPTPAPIRTVEPLRLDDEGSETLRPASSGRVPVIDEPAERREVWEPKSPGTGGIVSDRLVEHITSPLSQAEQVALEPLLKEGMAKAAEERAAAIRRDYGTDKPAGEALDIGDRFKRINWNPALSLPIIGSADDVAFAVDLYDAAQRVEAGKDTEQDRQKLLAWQDLQARDKTFGYKVLDVLAELPQFAGEIYTTGGLATAGRKGATKALERILSKELIEKLAEKQAAKLAMRVATGAAAEAVRVPVAAAPRIAEGTLERMTPGVKATVDGGVDLDPKHPAEGLWPALAKSAGDQYVEYLSERSGGIINELTGAARNALVKKGLLSAFAKLNPGKSLGKLTQAAEQVGWHGVLSEMAEERMGEVGRAVLGIEDYRFPTMDQLAVELVAFAIPGAGLKLAEKATAPRVKEPTATTPAEAVDPNVQGLALTLATIDRANDALDKDPADLQAAKLRQAAERNRDRAVKEGVSLEAAEAFRKEQQRAATAPTDEQTAATVAPTLSEAARERLAKAIEGKRLAAQTEAVLRGERGTQAPGPDARRMMERSAALAPLKTKPIYKWTEPELDKLAALHYGPALAEIIRRKKAVEAQANVDRVQVEMRLKKLNGMSPVEMEREDLEWMAERGDDRAQRYLIRQDEEQQIRDEWRDPAEEFDRFIKRLGGIPHPDAERNFGPASGNLAAELRQIFESTEIRTKGRNGKERRRQPARLWDSPKRERSLDAIAEVAREAGFSWIKTPADLIDTLRRRYVEGKEVFPDYGSYGVGIMGRELQERRDANEQRRDARGRTAYSVVSSERSPGVPVSEARNAIRDLIADWGGAPRVRVVQSVEDLPELYRLEIEALQAEDEMEGFVDYRDGSIFIIADNVDSPERAVQVYLHEVVGHYGAAAVLGPRRAEILRQVWAERGSTPEATTIAQLYKLDPQSAEDQLVIADEMIARMAEGRIEPGSLWERIATAVRDFLRRLGLRLDLSDADLRYILRAARSEVARSGAREMALSPGQPVVAWSREREGQRQLEALRALEKMAPVAVERPWGALPLPELRRQASEFYLKTLRPQTARTRESAEVHFTRTGLNETRAHSADRRVLEIIPGLPEIIAQAQRLETRTDAADRSRDIKAWHYLGAKVQIGEQAPFYARIVLREMTNGAQYYDNDATEIADLENSIAGTTQPGPDLLPKQGAPTEPTGNDHTLADWYGRVKPLDLRPSLRRDGRDRPDYPDTRPPREQLTLDEERDLARRLRTAHEKELRLGDEIAAMEAAEGPLDFQSRERLRDLLGERTVARIEVQELFKRLGAAEPARLGKARPWTPGEARPQQTQLRFSRKPSAEEHQVQGATLTQEGAAARWWDRTKAWLKGFSSPLPELPVLGSKAQFFGKFRQGYDAIQQANETVRKQMEETVAKVVAPLQALGREANDPDNLDRYRQLVSARRQLAEAMERGEIPADRMEAKTARLALFDQKIAALWDAKLKDNPWALFQEAVLYRDLWYRGSFILSPDGKPLTLPRGLTPEAVRLRLAEIHERIQANPHRDAIEAALRGHHALMEKLQADVLARGHLIPEDLRNPLYFPHYVLDRFTGRIGSIEPLTEDQFRGYLQAPVGSRKDIEADYLSAVYHHAATVSLHNAHQDIVREYWQPYDIKAQVQAELMEEALANNQKPPHADAWRNPENWPKGYALYEVSDELPLRPEYVLPREEITKLLTTAIADGDLRQRLEEAGVKLDVKPSMLRQALVAGQPEQWLIPEEIAAQLRELKKRNEKEPGVLLLALQKIQNLWKRNTLFAPWNYLRYEYGNTLTDFEKLITTDPQVFKYLPQAAREVHRWVKTDGREVTPLLRMAWELGVVDSVSVSEVGALKALEGFDSFLNSKDLTMKRVAGWFTATQALAKRREALFRYAKYLADLDRLQAGARPNYGGAYWRDVEAIDGNHAKAAYISKKTFGHYGGISVSGSELRKTLIPFYSWIEINFRYWANLFRNLHDQVRLHGWTAAWDGAQQTSRAAAATAVGFGLRLTLPILAVQLWNNGLGAAVIRALGGVWDDDDDLESQISEADRRRPHILLGRDAQGKIKVIYTPTAFADLLEWFGGTNAFRLAGDWQRGDITLGQAVTDWAKQWPADVGNKIIGSVGPVFKGGYMALSRKNAFPDAFDQRTIAKHDLSWAILGAMTDRSASLFLRNSLDRDFYATQDLGEWLQQTILQIRRRDPEQWASFEIRDKAADWKEQTTGIAREGGSYDSPDQQVLRNFRKAIYRADVANAVRFYNRLLDYGYTAERFQSSLRAQDPLSGLSKDERRAFVAQLSEAERKQLTLANRYYARIAEAKGHEKALFPSEKSRTPGGNVGALYDIILTQQTRPDYEIEEQANDLLEQSLK